MRKMIAVDLGGLEQVRGEKGSFIMTRIVSSLALAFLLGLFLSYPSFAEPPVFVYYTQEDSSLLGEPARKISFYSYAIETEETVKVFGFYLGPISPNDKRMNLVLSEEEKLQFQEAEFASSYGNEPFCAPMLFLPKESIQEAPALREERVTSGKTVSFFRGDNKGLIFPSTLPNLNYRDYVLATAPKEYLTERKQAVYATISPQEREELEERLDSNNRRYKDPSRDYDHPEKPKPNIWEPRIPSIPTNPEQSFMFFKNQIVRDLENFFKWGNLVDEFPGKPFSIIVYLSIFGSNGQVDYEPILEIPLFEIPDLNIISKQVEENFGVSMDIQ